MSPAAAAILEFTSDIGEIKKSGELTYITSKDAYIWAGISVWIAQLANLGLTTTSLDDVQIHAELYKAVANSVKKASTPKLPLLELSDILSESPTPQSGLLSLAIRTREYASEGIGLEILRTFLLSIIDSGTPPENVILRAIVDINEIVNLGYDELLTAGLISDPVIDYHLAIAILSFLPFSISTRTHKGRVVYRKIQATLWKYKRERLSGGDIQTNLTFEVARIARAIKIGLTVAYHEATKGAGDEPEE
jgi:hypothetical protein